MMLAKLLIPAGPGVARGVSELTGTHNNIKYATILNDRVTISTQGLT